MSDSDEDVFAGSSAGTDEPHPDTKFWADLISTAGEQEREGWRGGREGENGRPS